MLKFQLGDAPPAMADMKAEEDDDDDDDSLPDLEPCDDTTPTYVPCADADDDCWYTHTHTVGTGGENVSKSSSEH
jgi:hypothetical protein